MLVTSRWGGLTAFMLIATIDPTSFSKAFLFKWQKHQL